MINPNQAIAYIPPSPFTPTVTLVGGAGNTVPVYSTNQAVYERIANECFVIVYLTGDGGAEGAGTGVLNIALPFTSNAQTPAGIFPVGTIINGTEEHALYGVINGAVSTISLKMQSDTAGALTSDIIDVTGADQNNATRSIMMKFNYKI